MSAEQEVTPWDDFLSDFTLILDSGERIRCHKRELAKASPVLRAMLMTEMKETKTNEMNLRGFDEDTVRTFMKYVYTEECPVPKIKQSKKSELKMSFKKNLFVKDYGDKLNPQLMRLAHLYQVQGLMNLCEYQLKSARPLDKPWTAKDIRELGKDLDNEGLKECSERWMASDAFQTLTCGKCKKTTEIPQVRLKCQHCSLDTIVSGAQAQVEEWRPNFFQDDSRSASKIYPSFVAISLD